MDTEEDHKVLSVIRSKLAQIMSAVTRQPEVTPNSEEFERTALKLKGQVLRGELAPEDEAEVRRLTYVVLSRAKS